MWLILETQDLLYCVRSSTTASTSREHHAARMYSLICTLDGEEHQWNGYLALLRNGPLALDAESKDLTG